MVRNVTSERVHLVKWFVCIVRTCSILNQILTDGWLVLAVMTEKNIKDFRFGILSVHTEAIL